MPARVILDRLSVVPIMNYLYSLYDALVSISVPSDKARAVVDAMERDMGTTLATKQDLLPLATREDLLATKQDLVHLKQELTGTITELRLEMVNRFALQAQEIATLRADVARDMATLGLQVTVRLGSMLVVGFGLTLAALRLWA
jgi:hypothetical protein